MDSNGALPTEFQSSSILRYFIFLPISALPNYVDILRNEKPVLIDLPTRGRGSAVIHTELENAGELEDCCFSHAVPDSPPTGRPARPDSSVGYAPFEPRTTTHSLTNAYLLGLASHKVYGDDAPNDQGPQFASWFESKFDPWLKQGATNTTTKFDLIDDEQGPLGSGFQAMIMSDNDTIYLVIRGSKGPKDWALNVVGSLFIPVPGMPGVTIHSGWLAAAQRVYNSVLSRIKDHQNASSSKFIWFTGHSLGGAMANILALLMAHNDDLPIRGVYTFGAPPCGNIIYLDTASSLGLADRTHRWVNDRDPAPYLNFSVLPGSFFTGSLHLIDASGGLNYFQQDALIPPIPPQEGDHDMLRYGNALRNGLPASIRNRVPAMGA